jgi:hypothetical protein
MMLLTVLVGDHGGENIFFFFFKATKTQTQNTH